MSFKTKEEIEAERFENYRSGLSAHYVDLYVQLKRNIDIKTKILGQEQFVCELGYASPSSSVVEENNSSTSNSRIPLINFKSNKDKFHRLVSEFKTCQELHRTLLTQNFPLPGEYQFEDQKQQQLQQQPSATMTEKYKLRLKAVTEVLELGRRDIEEFEKKIEQELSSSRDDDRESEKRIQDLFRDRFLRVNKMLNDVSEKFTNDIA